MKHIIISAVMIMMAIGSSSYAQSFMLEKDIREHLRGYAMSYNMLTDTTESQCYKPLYHIDGKTVPNNDYITVSNAVSGKVVHGNEDLDKVGLFCFYRMFSPIPEKRFFFKFFDRCTVLTCHKDSTGSIYDFIDLHIRELLDITDSLPYFDDFYDCFYRPAEVDFTKAICRIDRQNMKHIRYDKWISQEQKKCQLKHDSDCHAGDEYGTQNFKLEKDIKVHLWEYFFYYCLDLCDGPAPPEDAEYVKIKNLRTKHAVTCNSDLDSIGIYGFEYQYRHPERKYLLLKYGDICTTIPEKDLMDFSTLMRIMLDYIDRHEGLDEQVKLDYIEITINNHLDNIRYLE